MSNSYFQFKQFRIEQDACAMKVSTDACIQGAWTPVTSSVKTVLDIGAGTGLLSLMIAQRNEHAIIDAIEIDPSATKQANENFIRSPWSERLCVQNFDIRQIDFNRKYDLIVCNPPFFGNSLLGERTQRNIARHTLSLSQEDLFQALEVNLAPDGYASILLPVTEHGAWRQLLKDRNWKIFHELHIVPRSGLKPNRIVSLCSRNDLTFFQQEELLIRDSQNNYTPEFIHLLRPFYLNL